jgi:hypothetical protein
MSESLPVKASALPRPRGNSGEGAGDETGRTTRNWIRAFRVVVLAFLVFLAVYVKSLDWTEMLLQSHFELQVARALVVNPVDGPIIPQIQQGIRNLVQTSAWIRLGEVRVRIHIYGADGVTPLFLEGRTIPPPARFDPLASLREAVRLLPATSSIEVTVPPSSVLAMAILVGYGAILITGLFFYNRGVAQRETALLDAAVAARDTSAQ